MSDRPRVLVVDDDPNVGGVVRRYLLHRPAAAAVIVVESALDPGAPLTGSRSANAQRPRRRIKPIAGAMVGIAVCLWSVGGCSEGKGTPERLVSTGQLADIEALADGGLLVAERETGRLLVIDAAGRQEELARVDVVADPGQRGLLGVVSDGTTTYASFTRSGDGRLVVAQVAPGEERLVWRGPTSADAANGGRLALTDDGLVIGIGDLTDPELVDEPDTPNGKLLLLDPMGRPDQEATVVSTGWNNPFAFTEAPDGSLRVADNAPGDVPERLARGDTPRPSEVVELEGTSAPSGVISDGEDLLVCGYVSQELRRYRPGSRDHEVVSSGCRFDVDRLADGRLALADDDGVVVIEAP